MDADERRSLGFGRSPASAPLRSRGADPVMMLTVLSQTRRRSVTVAASRSMTSAAAPVIISCPRIPTTGRASPASHGKERDGGLDQLQPTAGIFAIGLKRPGRGVSR